MREFLKKGIPFMACTPEIREFLTTIRSECPVGGTTEPAPPPAEGAAAAGEGSEGASKSCSSKALRGAFSRLKWELDRAPIGPAILDKIRHEIVYLSVENDVIADVRQEMLHELAAEYRSPVTRYAVITSPKYGTPDAERRGKVVVKYLLQNGVPPELIDGPWIYSLGLVDRQVKKMADRPVQNEARDLDRAVIVLRTDC